MELRRILSLMGLTIWVTACFIVLAAAQTVRADDYGDQISHAKLFAQPLVWVGSTPPSANETLELWRAAGLDAANPTSDVLTGMENFLKAHPDSAWTPSLEANLANYYYSEGRYSVALENWQKAWDSTKNLTDANGRFVADYAVAMWSQLLSSLGRLDELEQLIAAVGGRPLSNPQFQRRFDLAKMSVAIMKGEPGMSYRCGTFALYHVARAMNLSTNYGELLELPSPATGFSMGQLIDLADRYKLGLAAVERPAGDQQLVVPSVVHWQENHYAAIVGRSGGGYEVMDPTFGKSRLMSGKTINENASGHFIVPANAVPQGWQVISKADAAAIFGKGMYNGGLIHPSSPQCPSDDPCETCPTDCKPPSKPPNPPPTPPNTPPNSPNPPNNCGTCKAKPGMPDWEVQEPYISLWLHDRPMIYNMSFGRQFALGMDYHQRETRTDPATWDTSTTWLNFFNFGTGWNNNLLTYIKVDGSAYSGWQGQICYDTNHNAYPCNVSFVTSGGFDAVQFCPGGGQLEWLWGGTNWNTTMNPITHRQFVPTINQTTYPDPVLGPFGYTDTNFYYASNTIVYPNGSVAVFNQVITLSTLPQEKVALLTSATDPQGHTMQYVYTNSGANVLLTQVVDFDRKTNLFFYGNAAFPTAITQITNTAYGLAVNFLYDTNGYLTNVTDVMGISSSFIYQVTNDVFFTGTDTNGNPENAVTNSLKLVTDLHTPYGDTTFSYFHPSWPSFTGAPYTTNSIVDLAFSGINYAITVGQPDGGTNLFLYCDNNPRGSIHWIAVNDFCTGSADYNANCTLFGNQAGYWELNHCNSYFWGPRQYNALSTLNITNLTGQDLDSGRMRIWLQDYDPVYQYLYPTESLQAEQSFAPDAYWGIYGEATWYGYEGREQGDSHGNIFASTNDWLPCSIGYNASSSVAMRLQNITRNSLGFPTSVVDFGSDINCVTTIRTNYYTYAANGIDLLYHYGPDGTVQEAYTYDGNHNVTSFTNALNETTTYTYNANGNVTSVKQPDGLLTTNFYNANGFLSQQIVTGFSTNSYTYTNGLVYTYTDERGVTTTNTWDALQRLVKVAYPDGTSVSYVYSNLDLVRVVDRMGFTTGYNYDNMERATEVTNALGNATHYTYCNCGSLNSIVDAAGNTTTFTYDQAGRLTNILYQADGFNVGKAYDLAGDVVNVTDSSGNSVSSYYDGLLRLVTVTNTMGGLTFNTYDLYDQIITNMNANGVTVSMTYDALHRLQSRTFPDGGLERYGYTLNFSGPTAFTNQIGNVVLYGYDLLNRKTNEAYGGLVHIQFVGQTTNGFAYDGPGDLLTLTDGKGDKTSWNYDQYGRVTNKLDNLNNVLFVYSYDPDNRLTNRWSAAKTNTVYKYDAVGNLTNVVYPVSSNIVLKYDVLNRLTNMVDGVGTTVYGYDGAGQVLSEDGPWANDTVSYTYQNRLRTGLRVQAPNASSWAQGYGYDSARRLASVSSPAGTFGYSYNDGADVGYVVNPYTGDDYDLHAHGGSLVQELTLPSGAYITNTVDSVARLTGTWLMNSGGTNLDSYAYTYNQANQRTEVTRTAGDYVIYGYDYMGELKTAMGKEAGGVTNRWQEQFGYAYDAAGNLSYRTNNMLLQQFNVNSLNELSTVTNGGRLTVAGSTTSPATNVTVNTSNAVIYEDVTFASTNQPWVSGNNTYTAIGKDIYGRKDTNSVTVSFQGMNNYSYDLNGNLLNDGVRNFAYDDENELNSVYLTNVWRTDFVYDGKLRRRIMKEFMWTGSSWLQTNEVHYIYDGNLVVQERNANNLPTVTYTRGTDLSGTFQGAGGIGGLLARTDNSRLLVADPFAFAYYHCDGNGNVTCLLNPYQQIAAKYLYDPYGNTLSIYGSLAAANTYRFSSKEWNGNSGLYYYLYRFYDPTLQRWLNRDPMGENGFHQLVSKTVGLPTVGIDSYEFDKNSPTGEFDSFGLQSVLYYIGCFNKYIHPTAESQCGCLCVVDGSRNNDCYRTCVACSSLNNPRKACECALRARQDTAGAPNDFQIKEACKHFPDCDLPLPKPKLPKKPPEIP